MYVLKTAATSEPVTLAEVKSHMKVYINDDDEYISSLITAAREKYEADTLRQIMEATWQLYLDRFTSQVNIERCPVKSIESVKYNDSGSQEQTMTKDTDYYSDVLSEPGKVRFVNMPATDGRPNAICIEFKAGETNRANVAETDRHAIRLLAAHWYELRQPVITGMTLASVPITYDTLVELRRIPRI
ncbi:MAG: phage head-tail connector protein [Deltaproteobacteria bacterium]|nr:phage head-tail connector protein [Deltaproteobacteria bacterium]